MNIRNFENSIEDIILQRGRAYYLEGAVSDIDEYDDGEYVLYIDGRSEYEVSVEINESGDIYSSECDCPYEFGPVCKHEVAAYFYLRNMISQSGSGFEKTKKKEKKATLAEVLAQLSKEELVEIVTQLASDNNALKKRLIMRYAAGTEEQELETCRSMIRTIKREYMQRGFVSYREASGFAEELSEVADKAGMVENPFVALDIAFVLLEEAVEAFEYVDDSDGDVGWLVSYTLDRIREIAEKESKKSEAENSKKLFYRILSYADHDLFEGWAEFKMDLLYSCACFAGNPQLREVLHQKTNSMLLLLEDNDFARYEKESLLKMQLYLIETHGTKEEEQQFVKEQLHYPSFRKRLIEECLKKGDYQKVIELAQEGERLDHDRAGLVKDWKMFRYAAYQKQGLPKEQKQLAKDLFMGGDFFYYEDLKKFAGANFDSFYQQLKEELRPGRDWRQRELFLTLIETEQDNQELLAVVQKQPPLIEAYADRLYKLYPDEVETMYRTYIEALSKPVANRNRYKDIFRKISHYQKVAGVEKKNVLVSKLKEQYRKRPAFLDELTKMR